MISPSPKRPPTIVAARATIPRDYYVQTPVLTVAQELLGAYLCTQNDEGLTRAIITETEAYIAPEDRASHAYDYRRTPRCESMYAIGGTCYMYICYGIHDMCNVVTGPVDLPHAVLIRSVEPIDGVDLMLQRRQLRRRADGSLPRNLCAGPGLLCQALGLSKAHDGEDLTVQKRVWIEPRETMSAIPIVQTTRIGIGSSGIAVDYPYRFYIKDNPWVSQR